MSDSSCSICYEAFANPKMMTCCGKSICERCEHRYPTTNAQSLLKINSPLCGKEGAFGINERSVSFGFEQRSSSQQAQLVESTNETKSTTEKEDIEKCLQKADAQISLNQKIPLNESSFHDEKNHNTLKNAKFFCFLASAMIVVYEMTALNLLTFEGISPPLRYIVVQCHLGLLGIILIEAAQKTPRLRKWVKMIAASFLLAAILSSCFYFKIATLPQTEHEINTSSYDSSAMFVWIDVVVCFVDVMIVSVFIRQSCKLPAR